MLLQLRIRDFAVIRECEVTFGAGFIALTGETGAGKSILVDALSGCLGARLGADVIRAGADRAEMEAVFDRDLSSSPDGVVATLAEAGIQDDEVLILSREVGRAGRSLCRVNGRAVPLSVLASLGGLLVDIHGQSEHLSLLKPSRQLDILDHFGNLDESRRTFGEAAAVLIESRSALHDLEVTRRSAEDKLDLLRFQIAEIEGASIEVGEIESLNGERVRLINAEKLARLASDALAALDGDESGGAALDGLASAAGALRSLAVVDRSMEKTAASAEEQLYLVQDLATNVRAYRDRIEFDSVRLDAVEGRLDQLNRLLRKYGDTESAVLEAFSGFREQLGTVENQGELLARAQEAARVAENRAADLALALSDRRAIAATQFVTEVRGRLAELGLGPAGFEIRLDRSPSPDGLSLETTAGVEQVAFNPSGIDRIQFFVSFNPGEALKPIDKVASGGETARFMLAAKAVLANADDVPTLIFDEIDTGVGGRGGGVVAAMLRELASTHQVLSITHLPQIAAEASLHLKVTKAEIDGMSSVKVLSLDREGRVAELAEMLSGVPPTPAAVDTARELLIA